MKTRRQKEKAERHVRLYHWLVHSPAWRDLTANARAIYVEISSRYGGAGSNNGRIPYSVREAATSLRISKSTASRALIELQEHGFIALMKEGGFNLKARHAAEWRLTEFVSDVDPSAATKEFMRWRPAEIQNTVPLTGPTVPLVKPSRQIRTAHGFATGTLVVYQGGCSSPSIPFLPPSVDQARRGTTVGGRRPTCAHARANCSPPARRRPCLSASSQPNLTQNRWM